MERFRRGIIIFGATVAGFLIIYGYWIGNGEGTYLEKATKNQEFTHTPFKWSGLTWTPQLARVQAHVENDGVLSLVADPTRDAYQIVSEPIPCDRNEAYSLNTETKITMGFMGYGLIDQKTQLWVAHLNITEPHDVLKFLCPESGGVQIVIYNNSVLATTATIDPMKMVAEGE